MQLLCCKQTALVSAAVFAHGRTCLEEQQPQQPDTQHERISRQYPAAALQVRTAVGLVRQEGVLALWKGWLPGVTRGILYGGAQQQHQQQQG
jgi:hypothetical protein